MRHVRGRVLDVGCGGGRVRLHLQSRGLEIVGIDSSRGAIDACRRRGVTDARVLGIETIDASLGSFDTVVLSRSELRNAGLAVEGKKRAGTPCAYRDRTRSHRGRDVRSARDRRTVQHGYLRRNRERGRMPGQLRVRTRYRDLSTPWFDWLQVSRPELVELLNGTPWQLSRTLGDGPSYVAIIDRLR